MLGVILALSSLTIWSAQGEVINPELHVSCPLLFCPDSVGCTEFTQTTLDINGRKCMGCPKCSNAALEAKRSLAPSDLGHMVGCPMFKCAAPNCEHWEWQYSEFNGLRCRTCPACTTVEKREVINLKEAIIECPFVDCAYPGPCVGGTMEYSYMTWNGRKCTACGRCVMADIQKLLAHPLKRQIPIDMGNLLACPDIACALPGNCLHTQSSHFDWHGRQCLGCPVCAKDFVAEKKRQIPIDIGHLLKCPIVECAFPGHCAHMETSYFEFHGRQCPGCPTCTQNLIIQNKREVIPGEVIHLNICPMVMCTKPEPCDQPYLTSTMMWQGKECPGCQYCPKTKREVVSISQVLHMCPLPMCGYPGPCDHPYNTSYIAMNGMRCPRCPYCDHTLSIQTKREVINTGIIHLEMCPMPMCMAPGPCDHPYTTSFIMMGEKQCPMCPYCAKEKREIIKAPLEVCPLMPCAFPVNCISTKTSQFEHNGMMCQGCPVCVRFGDTIPG